MRIIIAEDDPNLRKLYRMSVETFIPDGVIDEVNNGSDLVTRVVEGNYDLVLTDNNMPPGLSGLEAIRQIRARGRKYQSVC